MYNLRVGDVVESRGKYGRVVNRTHHKNHRVKLSGDFDGVWVKEVKE